MTNHEHIGPEPNSLNPINKSSFESLQQTVDESVQATIKDLNVLREGEDLNRQAASVSSERLNTIVGEPPKTTPKDELGRDVRYSFGELGRPRR